MNDRIVARIDFIEQQKRRNSERVRLKQQLVRQKPVRFGDARGDHNDKLIDIGNRRTQKRVFSREQLVQGGISRFRDRNLGKIADHGRQVFISKAPARLAGYDFPLCAHYAVKPADAFDNAALHALQDSFAVKVKSCCLTAFPSQKRITSRVPSTSE
jgi:hypothetical protein